MERRYFLKSIGAAGIGTAGLSGISGCLSSVAEEDFELDRHDERVPVRKFASCNAVNCDDGYETAVFEVNDERWEVGAAYVKNDAEGVLFYRRFDPEENYLSGDYRLMDADEAEEDYSVEAVPTPFQVEVYDTGIEGGVETGTIELLFEEPVRWGRSYAL